MNKSELLNFVTPDENPGCSALFRYRGVRCSQSIRVFDALEVLHSACGDVTTVIEIGTLYGGFTRILRDHDISNGAELHTFDIVNTLVINVPNTTLHVGNVLSEEGIKTVTELIKRPGKTLVFCDGGHKVREIEIFSSILKTGDVIFCHDYVKYPEDIFDADLTGGFPGYESQWANISEVLTKNSCFPFCEMPLRRAMWGCFIKQ